MPTLIQHSNASDHRMYTTVHAQRTMQLIDTMTKSRITHALCQLGIIIRGEYTADARRKSTYELMSHDTSPLAFTLSLSTNTRAEKQTNAMVESRALMAHGMFCGLFPQYDQTRCR